MFDIFGDLPSLWISWYSPAYPTMQFRIHRRRVNRALTLAFATAFRVASFAFGSRRVRSRLSRTLGRSASGFAAASWFPTAMRATPRRPFLVEGAGTPAANNVGCHLMEGIGMLNPNLKRRLTCERCERPLPAYNGGAGKPRRFCSRKCSRG